ncbi:MAG: tRNA lysidine(34) synthetase TilS, partial [Candidatus Angelobacter sp.]
MIERVRHHIREERLLSHGERVAVAVSGGADSVALLRLLLELSSELGIVLLAAHFHHGIRGEEADADQQFVSDLCGRFGLELYSGSGDAPAYARECRVSLETAARDLRHHWFAGLIRENKAEKIATAHTLDDQAETVLMRVIRGPGARGLGGIASFHAEKRLVRPLLKVTRREVEQYLNRLGQTWREDLSNLDLKHMRNRIRKQLLPLLEQFNPSIRQTLAELAEIAQGEADYWDHERDAIFSRLVRPGKPSRSGRYNSGRAAQTWSVGLADFNGLPIALKRQLLLGLGDKIDQTLQFQHIQQLTALSEQGRKGKPVRLPGSWIAHCSFRELQFEPAHEGAGPTDYEYLLPLPGEIRAATLGSVFRATVVSVGKRTISGYNPALLLDRALLQP